MGVSESAFPLTEVIGIVACLFASAFFSGSETALTSVGDRRAGHLIETQPERFGILSFWLKNKKRILAALLVGNNAVNILCSVLAYQVAFHFRPDFAEAISVFGLTIIVLIFAEVTPKSLALYYSESIVVTLLRFLWVIDKLLWIVSAPLARIPAFFMLGAKDVSDEPPVTEDEIEYQIRLGHDKSVFEEKEQGDLLMSAVEFSDTNVKEVMIPRTDIIGLEVSTEVETALEVVIESGHSRIPIFRENLDNIVGLLYAKDLIRQLNQRENELSRIETIIRKTPFFAPETQKISDLLAKMRRRGQHMAIVVDEFGGTSGLITLEDIIEELVGDIRDEFDFDEAPVRRLNASTWVVDARVSLNDLKSETGIVLPDEQDYESVGGFVVAEHGTIPVTGTVIRWEDLEIKVLVSDPRRVSTVEMKLAESTDSAIDE